MHQIPVSIAEIRDFFLSIIIFYYRLVAKQRTVKNVKLLYFCLIQYNISQHLVQSAVCLRCNLTYGIAYYMFHFKPCSKLLFYFFADQKESMAIYRIFSLHIKANVNPLS